MVCKAADSSFDLVCLAANRAGLDGINAFGLGVSIAFGHAMEKVEAAADAVGDRGKAVLQHWCQEVLESITERMAEPTGFKFQFRRRDKPPESGVRASYKACETCGLRPCECEKWNGE